MSDEDLESADKIRSAWPNLLSLSLCCGLKGTARSSFEQRMLGLQIGMFWAHFTLNCANSTFSVLLDLANGIISIGLSCRPVKEQ